jgi:hypothetical protein
VCRESGKHGSEEGGAGKRRPLSDVHHYVRDVAFGEDGCRAAAAHQAFAAIRNAVTGAFRLLGTPNIAARLRASRRAPYRLPFQLLGLAALTPSPS